MVSLARFLQVNTLLITALLFTAATAENTDHWTAIFTLDGSSVLKRDLLHEIEN